MLWSEIERQILDHNTEFVCIGAECFDENDANYLFNILTDAYHIRCIRFIRTRFESTALFRLVEVIQALPIIIKVDFNLIRQNRTGEIHISQIENIIRRRNIEYKRFVNVCANGPFELVTKYLSEGFHCNGLHCDEMPTETSPLNAALLCHQLEIAAYLLRHKIQSCKKLGENTLDISNGHITERALRILFDELILADYPNEQSIFIHNIDCSNSSAVFPLLLSQKLPNCYSINNNLINLNVSNCSITNNLFQQIGSTLKDTPNLISLIADKNNIDFTGLKRFLKYFNRSNKLSLLSLKYNFIQASNDNELAMIKRTLTQQDKISVINITGNFLFNGYRERWGICEDLFQTERIQSHDISFCQSLFSKNQIVSLENWRVYLLALKPKNGQHVMLAYEGILSCGQRIFKVAHLTAKKWSPGITNQITISYYPTKSDDSEQEPLISETIEKLRQKWIISDFETSRANCLNLWCEVENEIEEGCPGSYMPIVIEISKSSKECSEEQLTKNCVKWAVDKIRKHLKIEVPDSLGYLPLTVVRDSLNGQDITIEPNSREQRGQQSFPCVIM